MTHFIHILIGFLLLYNAVSCKMIPQPEENPLTREINDALDYPVFRKQLSGIISVTIGKEEVFNKVYSLSNDIPENYRDARLSDDTQFMIGSLTKQFTAMAILILQQQGKLSLNDNINKFIPDFPWGNVINIHDILTHTAGLPRDPFHEYMIYEFDADFPDTFIRNIVTDPLRQRTIMNEYTFSEKSQKYILKKNVSDNKKGELMNVLFTTCFITDAMYHSPTQLVSELLTRNRIKILSVPGRKYNYSNLGYIILGYLIEQLSGQSLAAFMDENIFTPLGMSRTGYNYDVTSDFAIGLSDYDEAITRSINMEVWPGAAGGLHSTMRDLKNWAAFLTDDRILPAEQKAVIWGPYHRIGASDYGYGMMTTQRKINGKEITDIHHNGYIMSYNSCIHIIPGEDIKIVILSNDIKRKSASDLYGQEPFVDTILNVVIKKE